MLQFLLNYNYIVLMEHIEYQIIMQLAINNKSTQYNNIHLGPQQFCSCLYGGEELIQYVSASSHIQNDLGHNSLHIDFIFIYRNISNQFYKLIRFYKIDFILFLFF